MNVVLRPAVVNVCWANGEIWTVPKPKLTDKKAHFFRHRGRWIVLMGPGTSCTNSALAQRFLKNLQPVVSA